MVDLMRDIDRPVREQARLDIKSVWHDLTLHPYIGQWVEYVFFDKLTFFELDLCL